MSNLICGRCGGSGSDGGQLHTNGVDAPEFEPYRCEACDGVGHVEPTAANATHELICQHCCRWTKTYVMPCHILKVMPDGRLKLLVFGERHWKNREHVSRVRYVEAGRVRPKGGAK